MAKTPSEVVVDQATEFFGISQILAHRQLLSRRKEDIQDQVAELRGVILSINAEIAALDLTLKPSADRVSVEMRK